MNKKDENPIDHGNVEIISHICIRDPDTGHIILRKRDIEGKKDEINDR
jgi:hypothetical protein